MRSRAYGEGLADRRRRQSAPTIETRRSWIIAGCALGCLSISFGAAMIAVGLVLSSLGHRLDFYLGHGLLIGLLGNAGLNAPLYVYVARWFDRRRGTALALIAGGQAVIRPHSPPASCATSPISR